MKGTLVEILRGQLDHWLHSSLRPWFGVPVWPVERGGSGVGQSVGG